MYKINKDLKAYNTTKLNKSISIKFILDFLHIHHRNLYLLNSRALMALYIFIAFYYLLCKIDNRSELTISIIAFSIFNL